MYWLSWSRGGWLLSRYMDNNGDRDEDDVSGEIDEDDVSGRGDEDDVTSNSKKSWQHPPPSPRCTVHEYKYEINWYKCLHINEYQKTYKNNNLKMSTDFPAKYLKNFKRRDASATRKEYHCIRKKQKQETPTALYCPPPAPARNKGLLLPDSGAVLLRLLDHDGHWWAWGWWSRWRRRWSPCGVGCRGSC